MMGRDFLLPDLGEGLTEAAIVSWLVSPGDTIAIDQPVVEVESAKSIVELPSPFGGVVSRLFGEIGAIIHAGQVLLTVTDAAVADTSGAVLVGYGTSESTRPVRRPAEGRFGRKAMDLPKTPSTPAVAPVVAAAVALLDAERPSPVVSPLVRRLASENGFDAARLNGSGPQSLVL
ncbi:MAG TPA: biotin/lipoyl-containing protein, partial [Cryobacterium sp.]|nr:biotin/lipoyl-containing protein [Cryobacterium sp.]